MDKNFLYDRAKKILFSVGLTLLLFFLVGIAFLMRPQAEGQNVSVFSGFSQQTEPSYEYAEDAMSGSGAGIIAQKALDNRFVGAVSSPVYQNKPQSEKIERLVIRTASLSLVVDATEDAIIALKNIASELNGRVDGADFNNAGVADAKKRATVVLRIPADYFDEAIEAVKKIARKVEREHISSDDITGQIVDIEARLRNLRREEDQYLEIMRQAVKIPDIIQVSERLFQVRQQIEQLEAQKTYLSQEVEMSTITIMLSSEPDLTQLAPIWNPWTTVKQAFQAMLGGLASIADFAIFGFILLLPILVLSLGLSSLLIWIVWRIALKIKRHFHSQFVQTNGEKYATMKSSPKSIINK